MKPDYKRAFGSAPDPFKARVAGALQTVQEDTKVKKHGIRLALVLALLAVVLVGGAIAAVSNYGMLDFLRTWPQVDMSPEGIEALRQDGPIAQADIGDMRVSITEAVADGRSVYATVLITPQLPGDVYLWGDGGVQWHRETTDETQRVQTYLTITLDGKPVEYPWHEFMLQKDGTLAYMIVEDYRTDGDTVALEVGVAYEAVDVRGEVMDGPSGKGTLAAQIQAVGALEERHLTLDKAVDGLPVRVEEVVLLRTPMAVYYEVWYVVEGEIEGYLDFEFFREMEYGEEMLFYGASLRTSQEELGDGRWVQRGSLNLDKMPEALGVRAYVHDPKEGTGKMYPGIAVE